jgi:hypothetical protein
MREAMLFSRGEDSREVRGGRHAGARGNEPRRVERSVSGASVPAGRGEGRRLCDGCFGTPCAMISLPPHSSSSPAPTTLRVPPSTSASATCAGPSMMELAVALHGRVERRRQTRTAKATKQYEARILEVMAPLGRWPEVYIESDMFWRVI